MFEAGWFDARRLVRVKCQDERENAHLKLCDGLEHLEDEVQTRNSGYLCRCATKQTRVASVEGSQAFSHFPGDVSGVA